jgi:NADH dehydrogenase
MPSAREQAALTHAVSPRAGSAHACLQEVGDAIALRKRILANLETACLPTTPKELRKQLLSIVVCGGGPTVC